MLGPSEGEGEGLEEVVPLRRNILLFIAIPGRFLPSSRVPELPRETSSAHLRSACGAFPRLC